MAKANKGHKEFGRIGMIIMPQEELDIAIS